MPRDLEPLNLLDDLIGRAKAAGADAADAVFADAASVPLPHPLARPEKPGRPKGPDLGRRVLVGKRQATVSSTAFRPSALSELVERAVGMARAVPEDPYGGIAEPAQLATRFPALDTIDATEPSTTILVERAKR